MPVSALSGPILEALPHPSHPAGSLDPCVLAKWRLCPICPTPLAAWTHAVRKTPGVQGWIQKAFAFHGQGR